MLMMRNIARSLLPIAALAAAGCGDGAVDPDFAPPYVTFQGVITSSDADVPAEPRVALAWQNLDPDADAALKVAQELGVRTEFPVTFELDVTTLPPEEAMVTDDELGAARFAVGTILVYADGNGNGAADLLPLDAVTSIDTVLGVPERIFILYIEGELPAEVLEQIPVEPGFNLLREPIYEPSPGCTEECPPPPPVAEVLPLDTEIEIALTADPELARFLCAATGSSGGGGPVGCSDTTCIPEGAEVTCSDDGTWLAYQLCETPTLCSGTFCASGTVELVPGMPVPADWPCE
jgi:hypothetical protein